MILTDIQNLWIWALVVLKVGAWLLMLVVLWLTGEELMQPDRTTANDANRLIPLPVDRPIWDRFFGVFPLVIVGSREEDGRCNLAPKHLAMPLGWDNHFCFVCSPRHTTYHNVRRHGAFTVSYPRPTEVLLASLAAAPRCEDRSKPALLVLPTFPARRVDGVGVQGCYLFLECGLHSIVDGFGINSLLGCCRAANVWARCCC